MMFKKAVLSLSLIFIVAFAHGQTAAQVYDQYLDFSMARSDKNFPKAFLIGENLLSQADKLPAKAKIILFYNMAKLYEDSSNADEAIKYYEKVTGAEPDYYVPHLALGYLYYDKASMVYDKMRAIKNAAVPASLTAEYKTKVLKALPHLEKAQACDPEDETLTLIKFLYNSIQDKQGLDSLNTRLTSLSKNCVTLLSE